jgi:glucan phosphoethanolaminetransferase (alkaline phosphatase superfamily)
MSLQEVRKALGALSVLGVVALMNLDKIPESYINSLFYSNMDKLPEPYINALFHILMQFIFMYAFLAYVSKYKVLHTVITLFIVASVTAKLSYGSFLSIGILMSVFGASFIESADFVEANTIAVFVTGILFTGIVVSPTLQNKNIRVVFIFMGALYTLLPVIYDRDKYISIDHYEHWVRSGTARGLTDSEAHMEYLLIWNLGDRFPVINSFKGVADTIYFVAQQSDTSSSWTEVSAQEDSPDILIIGLGESLRSDHMGLYGYERDTTPLLSKVDDLRIYKNVYSGGTNTWASVPAMLTKVSQRPDLSKSIISLAKDAGYKTFWLSNQTKLRQADFSVSAIATQSDHVYFSASDDTRKIKHDAVLLPKLSEILEERKHDQKVLIVLNFYGSHAGFKQRYPKNYEIFKGINKRVDQYDNTVLYTDYILAQALELSSEYGAKFIYFSDHGLGNHHGDMPLKHDVRVNPRVDSMRVPLISNSDLNIDVNNITNLFYFECIFSEWSGISAKELSGDYCKESLADKRITFYDAQLHLRRISKQL